MPWSSHNMDSHTFEFVPQQEESTPDSIYPQQALVHPGDACTWDSSLWVYHQLDYVNRNDTQYPIVNNGNDAQVVPTASFGPANYTTNTTPLVAPFTQEPTSQEPLEAEVIGNGINSDETPDVHHQGREQDNPDTVFRCTWPGCTSTLGAKRSLTRHIEEKHVHPSAFPCRICQKTFSRKDNLKNHMRRIHGEQA
ncbi:hypothetical protein PENPOL_c005G02259 [Penicillium polonicum]|uniref:C2H2-type domain-containing protein n=1 Tax=Penicillium polonicum TaxID=60169 RepID=A0A1V6NMI1_PENPO|nr:hypothetical protein PENPOL_c005G02259 [Penicillium polonicum]